jgi:serine/threonine-protein kinase
VNEPRLTRASQMLGTPGYLAPEVFAGADPEPRHDIYSMGVLAAEMLSGRRPDPDSGISATAPEGVPASLWDYVRELGAWPVNDRPESCLRARERLAELGILPAEGVAPEDPTGRVQVFDVVGPLPSGWGVDGPLPGPPQHPHQQQHHAHVGQRPAGPLPSDGPGQSGGPAQPAGQRPAGAPPPGRTPPGPTRGATPPTAHQRSATPIQPRNLPPGQSPPAGAQAQPDQPDQSGRPKPRRRWPLAVASIVLVVAGLALGSSIWWADSLFGANTPGGERTPAPSTSATSAPLDPTATAGGACDFTEVGSQARTPAGEVLVCRKDGNAYVWKTS